MTGPSGWRVRIWPRGGRRRTPVTRPEGHSLAARLHLSLVAVVLGVALIQGVSTFKSAVDSADDLFDYHMQQMAMSLQSGRPLVDADAPTPLGNLGGHFDYVVQIWSNRGVQIFHSDGGLALPTHAATGFSNVVTHGRSFRVYSVQSGERVIQIAQDMSARRSQALKLALNTVAPVVLMVPVLALVMGWVVRRSLRPVQAVRAQVAARAAHDLEPFDASGLPSEIRPLVVEMNALLVRVRDAFQAQRHFVADAAHELRSPLTALRLQVQSLQRAAEPAARRHAEERLLFGIDRATHLVGQLLELARRQAGIDAGRPPADVPLATLARQVVAAESAHAAAQGIDLGYAQAAGEQDGADAPAPGGADAAAAGGPGASGRPEPVVSGHRDALSILLRNLVDNAVKYTPGGGRVDVGLLPDGTGWFVEDSGPGIRPADRQAVFERFHRGGAGSAQAAERDVIGSGLGLSIVRVIAEHHGATVSLGESAQLGGLRVEVRFGVA